MTNKKTSRDEVSSRSEVVGVRLSQKVCYLAEIAAREQQRTLSSFIEWAVRKALTDGMISPEPGVGLKPDGMTAAPPMWGEGLWDIDEADRFFLLALSRPDLMTPLEQKSWKIMRETLAERNQRINLKNIRNLWNESATLKGGK